MNARTYRPHQLAQGRCPDPCGRKRFLSRRDAHRAARALHPNEALRPYPCGQFWHYGITPQWVKRGDKS